MCGELCFHREDVCRFQTPFLCGPEGFGGVRVEVRKLDSRLVCICNDDVCVCVCRGMESWQFIKERVRGKVGGKSREMKSVRSLVGIRV